MSTRSSPVKLELKEVSTTGRRITAYAAVFGNLDRMGEAIQVGAFDKSLRTKKLTDIGVLVGHDAGRLPVGVPVSIRADNFGLLTQTKVFRTHAGDELLAAAAELKAAGSSLGLSIGYQVRRDGWGQIGGKSARLLHELDLFEYSFLPGTWAAANAEAHVVDVKASTTADRLTVLYEELPLDAVPWDIYRVAGRMALKAQAALDLPYLLSPRFVGQCRPGTDWREPGSAKIHGPSNAKGFHVREYPGHLFLVAPTIPGPREAAWVAAHEAGHEAQRYRGLRADERQCDQFADDMMSDWGEEE